MDDNLEEKSLKKGGWKIFAEKAASPPRRMKRETQLSLRLALFSVSSFYFILFFSFLSIPLKYYLLSPSINFLSPPFVFPRLLTFRNCWIELIFTIRSWRNLEILDETISSEVFFVVYFVIKIRRRKKVSIVAHFEIFFFFQRKKIHKDEDDRKNDRRRMGKRDFLFFRSQKNDSNSPLYSPLRRPLTEERTI